MQSVVVNLALVEMAENLTAVSPILTAANAAVYTRIDEVAEVLVSPLSIDGADIVFARAWMAWVNLDLAVLLRQALIRPPATRSGCVDNLRCHGWTFRI